MSISIEERIALWRNENRDVDVDGVAALGRETEQLPTGRQSRIGGVWASEFHVCLAIS